MNKRRPPLGVTEKCDANYAVTSRKTTNARASAVDIIISNCLVNLKVL
jgi:hypothetical protein